MAIRRKRGETISKAETMIRHKQSLTRRAQRKFTNAMRYALGAEVSRVYTERLQPWFPILQQFDRELLDLEQNRLTVRGFKF